MNKEFIFTVKKIRNLLESKKMEELKDLINGLDTFKLADIIEMLEPEKQVAVFRLLKKDTALEVFEFLEVEFQQELLQNFTDERAVEIFEALEPDDRMKLMDELPAAVAKRLLLNLSEKEKDMTLLLMGYEKGTSGHIMTPKYIRLKKDMTIAQALEKVRLTGKKVETISNLYVTDDYRKLEGAVSLKDLILEDPDKSVDEIMDKSPVSVSTDESDENVAKLFKDSDLNDIAVLDHEKRLVGVITVDDAIDIIDEEATEAALDKAGFAEINRREEDRSKLLVNGSLYKVLRIRIPFLLITLAGGMMAGGLIERFEDALAAITAVAFFVPVVMDMGGNVGTQSSTIFTRALVLGHIDFKRFIRQWLREISIGFFMGALLGLLGGFIAFFWQRDIVLGGVVSIALLSTITLATALGYLVPYILVKLGFDQAAGADPIITTIKDLSGLAIYFGLVSYMLM